MSPEQQHSPNWWSRNRIQVLVFGIPLLVLILGSLAVIYIGNSISKRIRESQEFSQNIISKSPALASSDSIAFVSVRNQLSLCPDFRDTISPLLDSLESASDSLKKAFYEGIGFIRSALDTVKDKKGINAPHLVDTVICGSHGYGEKIKSSLMHFLRSQNEIRRRLHRQPYNARPRDDFELSTGSTDDWDKNCFGGMQAEQAMQKLDLFILAVTERNRDLLVHVRDNCVQR